MNDIILFLEDESDIFLCLDDDGDLVLIEEPENDIELVMIDPVSEHYDPYEGEYEVTPRLNYEQILETKDKVSLDDVTVLPIPVVYTTNPYDGMTVVVG